MTPAQIRKATAYGVARAFVRAGIQPGQVPIPVELPPFECHQLEVAIQQYGARARTMLGWNKSKFYRAIKKYGITLPSQRTA